MKKSTLLSHLTVFLASYVFLFFAVVLLIMPAILLIVQRTGNMVKTAEDNRMATALRDANLIHEITEEDLIKKVSSNKNGDTFYLYCSMESGGKLRKYILFQVRNLPGSDDLFEISKAIVKESTVKFNIRTLFKDEYKALGIS